MIEPATDPGRRCSWCGTLNSAGDNTCSKCGAVFSSIQQPDVISVSAGSEAGIATQSEERRTSDQLISGLVDSSSFENLNDEVLRSYGLGPTFVSGQTRAFLVSGCLALYLLISLVGAVVDVSQVILLTNATTALNSPPPQVAAGEVLTLLIRLSLIGVSLLTAVAFLFWIYRAHQNLKALGASDLKYSPGWAIGGFFVPLLNFVRPYQVVTEIWKASASGSRRSGGVNWSYEQTPIFISLWWGAWLMSGLLDSLSVFVVFGAGGGNQLLVASRYRLAYDLISIASAALAMTVVLTINARQERANRINSSRRDAGEPEIERYQL